MGIVIGLDIGGSTTKIVGFHQDKLLEVVRVRASDPVASAYGGLGKFMSINQLSLADVELIRVTGVGASYIETNLLERPTSIAPEFKSVGLGGLYVSGKEEAIIVSMGTGTSIVAAHDDVVEHIIGSGVGGGTLIGLSSRLINVRDFELLAEMAEEGDITKIDLTVGDISRREVPGLSMDTTASNFGRISDSTTPVDLAIGIVNLVFQSVGTAAVLASRLRNVTAIVFTGNLMLLPQGKRVLQSFAELYNVEILAPEHAEFATAIGAALTGKRGLNG